MDTREESLRLLKEAEEDLNRAVRYSGLKEQTLNLIHDACFVYDPEHIKEVFKMILDRAEQSGIIYDTQERVFKSKKLGRTIFSLK